MAWQVMKGRLVCTLLALGGVLLCGRMAVGGDTLRLSQNLPGDSSPITLTATEISTWVVGSERVFLLKGAVLAEQGVVRARMQGGVAWVDPEKTRQTGVLHLELYAEGDVAVEDGPKSASGPRGFLDLNTRGELKLNAEANKVAQQPRPKDPLFQRAVAWRTADQRPAADPAIQLASAVEAVPDAAGRPGGEAGSTLPYTPAPMFGGDAPSAPPGTPATTADPRNAAPVGGPGSIAPGSPTGAAPATGPYGPPETGVSHASPATPAFPAVDPNVGPSPTPPPASPGLPVVPPAATAATPVPTPPRAPTPVRQFFIAPRTSGGAQFVTENLPNGEQALVITGGVILTVRSPDPRAGLLDMEADRVVVWSRENFQQLVNNLRGPQGHSSPALEFYLSGNVEIREQNGPENRTLRAEEVYYDVGRNVAVATNADIEFKQPSLPDLVHIRAQELQELSPTEFRVIKAYIFSSRLPSDPGLTVGVAQGTLEEKRVPKRSIFGRSFVNSEGLPETEQQRLFRGESAVVRVEDFPIFYLPFIQGDANDPLGPLRSVSVGYNKTFGFEAKLTFNVYDLIGIDPIPGTKWDLDTDYLSARGPGLGTEYDYAGKDLFGLPGKYTGLVKAYGIDDRGEDILGGNRGAGDNHPELRGRLLIRHFEDLPEDFTVQLQVAALSDKNFLEQYYENEFDTDVNQETFVYVKQQRDNWAWTLLLEPGIRPWVTQSESLPRADGYLIGQSFFDVFTYNAHASAGYLILRTPNEPPPPFVTAGLPQTTQDSNSGRFDLNQELSLPFTLGFLRLVPYVTADLAYYTEDLDGDQRGRVYGGVGLRASMPLSRLYPDVRDDLLNIDGLNHKIVLSANYYTAKSDTPFTKFAQFDRLNDDATDQALRDIKPQEPLFNPANGLFLATSPVFDPQLYAIRQLLMDRIDTLDTIDELQLDIRQRLQTKRGYPGNEHIVDWMTLDMSATVFPHSERDNFGETFGFLQYDYTWNVGDRTALVSTGWFDPGDERARVFTIGTFLNRTDRTNFYLGYRQIDPLESRAVTASVTYVFSPKYAMTGSTTFDFGTNLSVSNGLSFTRMGSDLQFTAGITYNAITNNFGATLTIVPNLLATSHAVPGIPAFGSGPLGR